MSWEVNLSLIQAYSYWGSFLGKGSCGEKGQGFILPAPQARSQCWSIQMSLQYLGCAYAVGCRQCRGRSVFTLPLVLEASLCQSPSSDWHLAGPLSCATSQHTPKLVSHWGAVQELLLAPPLMHLAASSVVSAIPAWRGQAC